MAYSHINIFSEAIRQYEKENGKLPKDLNSLAPKHIKRVVLIDPWGYEYNYRPNNKPKKRVYSLGSDGKEGGKGTAMDFFEDLKSEVISNEIQKPIWGCNT